MGADSYKITKYCVEPLHHLGEQSKVGVVAACRAVHLLTELPEAKVTFLCIEHQHKYMCLPCKITKVWKNAPYML